MARQAQPGYACLIWLALLALGAPAAHAQSAPGRVARALESDPVYVHPAAAKRLSVAERGRLRLAIVDSAIGRIKIAVVPERVVARSGSLENFAKDVDRTLDVRGAAVFVAGPAYWVITSYPDSGRAVSAVSAAVSERDSDPLDEELLRVVKRLASADPGAGTDVGRGPDIPEADDFLDDVGDAFRLGVLIVAAAIALPFLLVAAYLVYRARRRRAREEEVRRAGERSADRELVELGDDIRSLDLDTSMPDANRAALTEYEQAIAAYDQANELLEGERTEYRVEQARAAIAAGRRHIAAARERLG